MDTKYAEYYKELGNNIAYLRKSNGYTRMQFPEALNISETHMTLIELGKNSPSVDLLFKICDVLDIHPLNLFSVGLPIDKIPFKIRK